MKRIALVRSLGRADQSYKDGFCRIGIVLAFFHSGDAARKAEEKANAYSHLFWVEDATIQVGDEVELKNGNATRKPPGVTVHISDTRGEDYGAGGAG